MKQYLKNIKQTNKQTSHISLLINIKYYNNFITHMYILPVKSIWPPSQIFYFSS